MANRYLVTAIFIFLTCTISICQTTYSVSGTIRIQEEPVAFGIVQLLTSSDSTALMTELTDDTGSFSFENVSNGTYLLSLNSISVNAILPDGIVVSDGSVLLDDIYVKIQSVPLDVVKITSKRKAIRRKSDRIEISIKDTYFGNSGLAMESMLNVLPTVQYKDRQLKINNLGNPLILIDGVGSKYLNTQNLQRILVMDPSQIEKVEIFTNPPARFDADGSAVINIITYKRKMISTISTSARQGFFQETTPSHAQSIFADLNFNFGLIKSYLNLGVSNSKSYQKGEYEYLYTDRNLSVNGDSDFLSVDKSLSQTVGILFDASSKDQFLLEFDTYYSYDNPILTQTEREVEFLNTETSVVDSVWKEKVLNNRSYTNRTLSFGYWHKGETKIDLQSTLNFNRDISEKTFEVDNGYQNIENNNVFENSFQSMTLSSNLERPISNLNFSVGVKYSSLKSDQDVTQSDLDPSIFSYQENIASVYAELTGVNHNIEWKIGLRNEYTSWKAFVENESNPFDKNSYNTLFPSLFLSKDFKESSMSLSYSKRISRPYVSEFNPTTIITNNTLILQEGQLRSLLPKLFDNYNFGLNYKSFSIDISVSKLKNQRVLFPVRTEGTSVVFSPISIGQELNYGGTLSKPISIGNGILNLRANIYYVNATIENDIKAGGYESSFGIFLNQSLHKNLKFNFNCNYMFPYSYGYSSVSKIISLNLGFRYAKQSSPFTFSLRLRDPLGINKFGFTNRFDNYQSIDDVISNSRAISMNILYKFNMTKEFLKESLNPDKIHYRSN